MRDSNPTNAYNPNNATRFLLAILKIIFALFCVFILIATLVYHWEFSPYLLKFLGILIVLASLFNFIRIFYNTSQTNEVSLYECDIQHNTLLLLVLIASLIFGVCFYFVDIFLGIGVFLYLLELCLQDWYYKAQISETYLTLYHRIYGKLSYKWNEILIASSLDEIQSSMLYVNLSDTYYLHIWHKNMLINITIKKDEKTLELYEHIKRHKKQ
ncbi:Integral membrane protein [Helicobacter hepaticus]|uniref:Uncharacterized protein n=1 Tax=Helicobacter hepaticus (strain ATCC 51449 / 3B1) TaxID=235279 RepID=Q7VJK7_HELHP|nr:hypothetical protein HH_0236 [Helicobacter hepaticus ATCC 51449]